MDVPEVSLITFCFFINLFFYNYKFIISEISEVQTKFSLYIKIIEYFNTNH